VLLIENFIALFVESSPWLLLGFVIAGLIKGLLPADFLSRHLGGKGAGTTVKAAVIGAPLPLCSCGVVPAALGLRKSGASKNATVAFLVSTPETGVDSVSVSYALLGPFMAVIRPIAAITSGIVSGLLVGKSENESDDSTGEVKSCCASEKPKQEEVSCCSKKQAPPGFAEKLQQGLTFSFVDLLKDIGLWLLIGLAFAAVVRTWVPEAFLAQWGDGFLAFVVMAVIGVPMYICATASTPIAAGLLLSGMSPGAVLVFMMAGPATNIGTLAIIGKELGKKALSAYLSGVIITAFVFGYLTNYLVNRWNINVLAQAHGAHEMLSPWIANGSAVVLALALAHALYKGKLKNSS